MAQFDIGEIRTDMSHDLAPEDSGLEHIGLVDRTEPAVTAAGDLKCRTGNTFDLRFAIDQGIITLAFAGFDGTEPAGFPEINTARELTHDHDIETGDDLRPQCRGSHQLRVEHGRPQI